MMRLVRFLICVSLFAAAAFADVGVLIPGDEEEPDPSVLTLDEARIDIRIDHQYARIRIIQIFGNHTTITAAGSQGHFELNVYKPVMAHAMLQSIRLMSDAAVSFTDNCVAGIRADEKRIKELMERSLMLVTALAPRIGYDNAAKIAKSAHAKGTTLREEAVGGGFVSADEFDRLVRPEKMVRPG